MTMHNGELEQARPLAELEALRAEVDRLRAQVRDLLVCQQVFVDGWQSSARECQELRERLHGLPGSNDLPPW